jgi:Ca-activated chloride channel family protein
MSRSSARVPGLWIHGRGLPTLMVVAGGLLAAFLALLAPASVWWTPDQRGMRLAGRGDWEAAAEVFGDAMWRGVALYRAGRFEQAALELARVDSPEGAFARGNALVLAGSYDEAIAAYDEALTRRPGWEPAEANREIARLRAERLRREGGEGTGGKLGADDVQVSDSPGDPPSGEEVVEVEGEQLDDASLQALWLRRLETSPADFLKTRFAYQAAKEER